MAHRNFFLGKSIFGRWPKSKKEEQEFGKAKRAIVLCPKGEAVYFNKRWHHQLDEYKNLNKDTAIRFELCPADKMKEAGQFEGILTIENIPPEAREEVVRLVKNIGARAFRRDVLDRILDIDYRDGTLQIKTSENQLAIGMARQIQRAHKKSTLDIQFSKQESVARARLSWN